MNVLFIMPLRYPVYPFQIASISSFLKSRGHKVQYLELILKDYLDDINKQKIYTNIEQFNPDLIAISSYQLSFEWVKQICSAVKAKKNIPTIVGGYHSTLDPEQVIAFKDIDMICRGEGEYPLLELLQSLEKGSVERTIRNIWFKEGGKIIKNPIRPLMEDLDLLPFMDREMLDYQSLLNNEGQKRYLAVMGSRGCPFNCSNCSNHSLKNLYPNKNKYVRLRSVDNIIEEIKCCREKFSFEAVSFEDDTFTLYDSWLEDFCVKYKKEIGLGFRCNARPEKASLKTMKLLKDAGCEHISVGVEAGDEKIRKQVLRRNISNEKIKKVFSDAKKVGLKVRSFNMVGLPYETRKSLLKTIMLNLKLAPYQVQTTIYYPFKGTDLGDLCYQKNWIDMKRKEKVNLLSNDSILKLPDISRYEIIAAKWLNSLTVLRSGNFEIIKLALRMLRK